MSEILNLRNIDYNLHFQIDFKEGPVNGELSSPKNMEYISYEAGSASSLTEFTTNIKSWIPKHFLVHYVEFIFTMQVLQTKFDYRNLFLRCK